MPDKPEAAEIDQKGNEGYHDPHQYLFTQELYHKM